MINFIKIEEFFFQPEILTTLRFPSLILSRAV